MENGIASAASDGVGNGALHSPRHQTKSQMPRRDEDHHDNGADATALADGELDDCDEGAGEETNNKHQLELRPQASWTFSSAPPLKVENELRKSRSSSTSTASHEGQVFMDEAKKFILFYAESAVTIKDLENNTQDTYQYALPPSGHFFYFI
jgi:hypothetical protein